MKAKVATSGIGFAGLEETSGPIIADTPFELTEKMIPKPVGYQLLVAIPQVEETYAGGILKIDQEKSREEVSTIVMQVIDMGSDAYSDKDKFPSGPYCGIGDHVLVPAYAGTRFKIFGKEIFRVISDDMVEAIIEDPKGYTRV